MAGEHTDKVTGLTIATATLTATVVAGGEDAGGKLLLLLLKVLSFDHLYFFGRTVYGRASRTAYRTAYTRTSSRVCCAGYTGRYPSCRRKTMHAVLNAYDYYYYYCAAVCSPSCRNGGSCVSPNRCNCRSTWTGGYCQVGKSYQN